jgi:hypothetical protein
MQFVNGMDRIFVIPRENPWILRQPNPDSSAASGRPDLLASVHQRFASGYRLL